MKMIDTWQWSRLQRWYYFSRVQVKRELTDSTLVTKSVALHGERVLHRHVELAPAAALQRLEADLDLRKVLDGPRGCLPEGDAEAPVRSQ